MADDVDISGMPDPPPELSGASDDISNMPTPVDLFKQQVGREPYGDYELDQFKQHPENFGIETSEMKADRLAGEAHARKALQVAKEHPFTAAIGLGENALAGVAGGVADLANAVTMTEPSDPHKYVPAKWTQPHTEAGKQIAELGGEETAMLGKRYTRVFGEGPLAETVKEYGPEAFGAVTTVAPIIKGGGAVAGRLGSGALEAGRISDFGGSSSQVPPPVPTAPTPAVEGPVTGEALRAQPDPLAQPAPAATPAAPATPEAPAGAAPGPATRVPGKPHITLKAKPSAPVVPAAEPAIEPATEPQAVRFTAPSAEGAKSAAAPADEQASRQATLQGLDRLAGGQLNEVRTSALTNDYNEAGTDYQHSRINDAGGRRMTDVIAGETNALRSAANGMVERTGTVADGVDQPALRQRGTVISNAISGIENWFDNNIRGVYETAKQRARGIPIQGMQNLAALAGDESQFAGTMEGEALYRGVQARARKLGLIGDDGAFKPATVEQAEQMRQALGEMWTPRTSQIIGRLKDALDFDVAQHGGADLFARARALRAQKGRMLEDPTGIAQLLHPEDRLGINRAVPLEQVPDYVANLPADQFNHVINVLKSAAHLGEGELAEPAAAAIREIKGHMAAKLHEAGSAKIQGGWDAKSLYRQLNQYSNKMPSVFSPREMQDWKTINDASNVLRMDRSYPGAGAQIHNTGVAASIREGAGKAARGAVDVAAHHTLPIAGPILAEATGLSEKVGRFVGGDAEARRLAQVEKRITPLEKPTGTEPPSAPRAPLGQRIGGARQRGGPKFEGAEKPSSYIKTRPGPKDNEVQIADVNLPKELRGKGNGVKMYQALADKLHAAGKTLVSDTRVSEPAQRMYAALKRRGYDVHQNPAELQGSGELVSYGDRPVFEVRPTEPPQPLGARIFGGKQRGAVGVLGKQRPEKYPAKLSGKEPLVNVGLKIGDEVALTPDKVQRVLQSQGVKVLKRSVHESTTEPTVVATLDKPLSPKQASTVSALLKQDAIAQYDRGVGQLHGPKAAEWGPFNPDYFLTHEGKPLSARTTPNPTGSLEFRHFSNLTDNKVTLDPARYGEGLRGAERNRILAGAPKVTSAYGVGGEVEPELKGKTEYSIKVPEKDMYDLSADPAGIKQAVRDDNGGVYDHSEAERMIKEAGYTGYHLPTGEGIFKGQARFFNKMPAERVKPEPEEPLGARIYGGKQRGAVGNLSKKKTAQLNEITPHLTDAENKQLRADTTDRLIDAFHKDLPPTEEYAAAALAGKAKKGWYANSAAAIGNVFGPDAPRFSALLASMSPQTSVQMNFHNALRTFINWDKAGRPTDPAKIKKIMSDSVMRSEGGEGVLGAWVNNSVRALTHPEPENMMLSGPKVHSFMRNLQNDVNEVTNDAWMSSFAKVDPARIRSGSGMNKSGPGKTPTYIAMSARTRAAAKLLTHMTGEPWTPREVQETIWSWAKVASEHADSFGALATIPELVKDGEIKDELINASPDFHQLFSNPEHSGFIGASRYAANAQRMAQAAGGPSGPSVASKATAAAQRALQPHLEAAAKRLEEVRQERAGEDDQEMHARRRDILKRARERAAAKE